MSPVVTHEVTHGVTHQRRIAFLAIEASQRHGPSQATPRQRQRGQPPALISGHQHYMLFIRELVHVVMLHQHDMIHVIVHIN